MGMTKPADRSTDASGRLRRLAYFVIVSLLLHGLLVGLWRDEPAAGPIGQSTYQITVLARQGDVAGGSGGETGQPEDEAAQQPPASDEATKKADSVDEATKVAAPVDKAVAGKPRPKNERVASVARIDQVAPESKQRNSESRRHASTPEKTSRSVDSKRPSDGQTALAPGRTGATPGSSRDGQQALSAAAKYHRVRAALHEALLPHFEYPLVARRRGWEGRVRIGLHIEADGDLTGIRLVESSGYALLDKAAVKNVTELRTVPALTQWLGGRAMDLILPVSYRLDGQ